jgi:hypothetical protein
MGSAIIGLRYNEHGGQSGNRHHKLTDKIAGYTKFLNDTKKLVEHFSYYFV